MKYKVEYAQFHTIEIEAESKDEVQDIAAMMDDEEIIQKDTSDGGMVIWEITEVRDGKG